ncbi:hypothetical protein MBOT_34470 [Mycobacterium botniense]|uniref:Uncharacterized protein n=1 Tax=Mycobacterium botniense TaxID=84962 RepID=A0A7I9Y1X9_9MYCO|nr:hypothetical protein MBOT_34470 [Mycobacterium botniense]
MAATQALLARIAERVDRGTLTGAARIGEAVGKVINKYKVGKHFRYQITDTGFTYGRDEAAIAAEAALDGIYVLRTCVPAADLDAPPWCKATRTSPTSNATSAASKPTTSTCGPSTTGCPTVSKPTC